MIRVLLDTNVWISLLLRRSERSAIPQVIDLVFSSEFQLFVPQELIQELYTAIEKSVYLKGRIPKTSIDIAVEQFYAGAIVPPVIAKQDSFTRDPKDDYLVVYALVYEIDYLVTGDLDLLALQQVGKVQIVTPSELLERLQ